MMVVAVAYGLVAFYFIIVLWNKACRVNGVLAPMGVGVGVGTVVPLLILSRVGFCLCTPK